MDKFTKVILLAFFAVSTVNALSPVDSMGQGAAQPLTAFDAAYVKSTETYQSVQSGVALAADYVGQATCVAALCTTSYVVSPLVVKAAFFILPTFYLGAVLLPTVTCALIYKTIELGLMPAKEYGSVHGKRIGQHACDKMVDGSFSLMGWVGSFFKSTVAP